MVAAILTTFGLCIGPRLGMRGLTALLMVFNMITTLWIRPPAKWATLRDEEVIEDTDDEMTQFVEVAIYQDGVLTGSDRGLMVIDGSTLIFMGHRSEFVLNLQDHAVPNKRHSIPYAVNQLVLHLKHPTRDLALSICVVTTSGSDPKAGKKWLKQLETINPAEELRKRSKQWLTTRTLTEWNQKYPRPEEMLPDDGPAPGSIYPPLATDPKIALPKLFSKATMGWICALFLVAEGGLLYSSARTIWLGVVIVSGMAILTALVAWNPEEIVRKRRILIDLTNAQASLIFPATPLQRDSLSSLNL